MKTPPPIKLNLSTSGKHPRLKMCFPQYFGITIRYMQNKFFRMFFLLFTASVRSWLPGPPLVLGLFEYVYQRKVTVISCLNKIKDFLLLAIDSGPLNNMKEKSSGIIFRNFQVHVFSPRSKYKGQ